MVLSHLTEYYPLTPNRKPSFGDINRVVNCFSDYVMKAAYFKVTWRPRTWPKAMPLIPCSLQIPRDSRPARYFITYYCCSVCGVFVLDPGYLHAFTGKPFRNGTQDTSVQNTFSKQSIFRLFILHYLCISHAVYFSWKRARSNADLRYLQL